jgi:hypothetical protein
MTRGGWWLATTLGAGLVGSAAAAPVYLPPSGFFLAPSDHSRTLAGPTGPDANWNIAQWGIPQDLPPFDAHGVAQNRWARVAWLGGGRFELMQDGGDRPCDKTYPSGRTLPAEFDLFAQPDNGNYPGFRQAGMANRQRLSDITHIDAGLTLLVRQAALEDDACRVTRVGFGLSVVVTDMAAGQTFFYQLRLAWFEAGARDGPRPNWFFTGTNVQAGNRRQYGFGDNVTFYGEDWARAGRPAAFRLDLLPRLTALIGEGTRFAMDQDLRNWRLTGMYIGQAVYGHMRDDGVWSGLSIEAE